jgi:hypothetical protein
MQLLLPFKIQPSSLKIFYTDKILFIGSCFSEEIGNRMKDLKFDVLQNPNGILYDPLSISSALVSYVENKKYTEGGLFSANELWNSWQHHSVFSGTDKESVLQNINSSQNQANLFLKEAQWLIITPGTSYNYILQESRVAVANCHKAPAKIFDKNLLSTEEMISAFTNAITQLQEFNPKLKIIFTVSPVRHVRDGVIENNRSKARLIEAIHSVTDTMKEVFYFPAYELVIDVLRDYRFYKNDFVHVNDVAVDFVFENFCNVFVGEPEKKLIAEIKEINLAMNHKPFHAATINHKKFRTTQLGKIKILKEKFPSIDFSKEEKYFSE